MTRVLSSACVVLVLLAVGGRAGAGPKPTIAILGLEVYDNGSGIDPETTRAAKELTAVLRDRARAGTGPYAPATSGDKELIDEKLLNNCDTEAPVCMAAIGTELGADLLMYGKIEKSTLNGQPIYKVSIKLLYVSRKQIASSTVETLPLAESSGVRASTHGKNWYAKLVGVTTGGTIIVKANIDRGTVLLDEEAKGTLASGTLSISGIPEGRHTLAIEAKDYQRYETSITVRAGEALPHTATLVEMAKKPAVVAAQPTTVEGTVSTKSETNIWKPVFYTTAALDAAAIGFTIYEWQKAKSNVDGISKNGAFAHDLGGAGPGLCDSTNVNNFEMTHKMDTDATARTDLGHYKDACSNYKLQKVGWVVSGVMTVAVVGSFVMAFIRDRDHAETQAGRGHKKRREFAITPIVSPDGGGATLRIDW
jgi:PEGA domain-containing protein